MTTITAETKRAKTHQEEARPQREDLRAAYEVHTLARILLGHLASARPWTASPGLPGLEARFHRFWLH
jgi:hypothetical protein